MKNKEYKFFLAELKYIDVQMFSDVTDVKSRQTEKE